MRQQIPTIPILALASLALVGCHREPAEDLDLTEVVTPARLGELLAAGVGEELIVESSQLADDDLALLENSPQLKRVEFRSNATPLGDAALAHLSKLPNLEWINLSGGAVTDVGMECAAQLPKLRILNLHATQITDAGLQSLAPLENLELLRCGSVRVTDAGIEHIAAIKHLRFLHLIDVPITDEGLRSIAAMPTLESFYLDGGKTSDEGLGALVKARPDLHFHYNERHIDDDPRRDDHSHGHDHGEEHGYSHGE